jgi:hypothetical protein
VRARPHDASRAQCRFMRATFPRRLACLAREELTLPSLGLHCFPDVDLPLPQQSDVHEGRLALRIDLERLLGSRQPRVEATGRPVESREAHVSPDQLRLELDRAVSWTAS